MWTTRVGQKPRWTSEAPPIFPSNDLHCRNRTKRYGRLTIAHGAQGGADGFRLMNVGHHHAHHCHPPRYARASPFARSLGVRRPDVDNNRAYERHHAPHQHAQGHAAPEVRRRVVVPARPGGRRQGRTGDQQHGGRFVVPSRLTRPVLSAAVSLSVVDRRVLTLCRPVDCSTPATSMACRRSECGEGDQPPSVGVVLATIMTGREPAPACSESRAADRSPPAGVQCMQTMSTSSAMTGSRTGAGSDQLTVTGIVGMRPCRVVAAWTT